MLLFHSGSPDWTPAGTSFLILCRDSAWKSEDCNVTVSVAERVDNETELGLETVDKEIRNCSALFVVGGGPSETVQ